MGMPILMVNRSLGSFDGAEQELRETCLAAFNKLRDKATQVALLSIESASELVKGFLKVLDRE